MDQAASVFIVGSNTLVGRDLRGLLPPPAFRIVGETDSAADALTTAPVLCADLIVLAAAGADASALVGGLRRRCPASRVVAIDGRYRSDQSALLHRVGASAYVAWDELDPQTAPCLLTLALKRPLPPVPSADGDGQPHALTAREREVLVLFAQGVRPKQIAARLHVTPQTVGTYRNRLAEKLGVTEHGQIVAAAQAAGLL